MSEIFNAQPRWERLPSPGSKLEQFSRSTILRFIDAGLIKSKLVSLPGAKRGMRFVDANGLRTIIANGQDAHNAATPATA